MFHNNLLDLTLIGYSGDAAEMHEPYAQLHSPAARSLSLETRSRHSERHPQVPLPDKSSPLMVGAIDR